MGRDPADASRRCPPPTDLWVRGPILLIAVAVGALSVRSSRLRIVSVCVFPDTYLRSTTKIGDSEQALAAGDEACDWLTGQPWGQPPGAEALRDAIVVNKELYLRALKASGATSDEIAMQKKAADLAWRYLCERQRWLHRQVLGD